jgi:hypothetical protein
LDASHDIPITINNDENKLQEYFDKHGFVIYWDKMRWISNQWSPLIITWGEGCIRIVIFNHLIIMWQTKNGKIKKKEDIEMMKQVMCAVKEMQGKKNG